MKSLDDIFTHSQLEEFRKNACTYKITHSYVAQKSKVIFVVKDLG